MCSPKTLLIVLITFATILILGYAFVPQIRVAIIAFAPFAFLAICPLSMIIGMTFMSKNTSHQSCHSKSQDKRDKI